jgi:GNAT superfamily N-acetyltransferase
VINSFHLAEVAVPLDPLAPWGPVWDGIRDASLEHHQAWYGYTDLADDNTAGDIRRYPLQDERRKVWLVALRGERPANTSDGQFAGIRLVRSEPGTEVDSADDVLAVTFVGAPLLDNTHMLETNPPQVRPSSVGLGIEQACFDCQEQIARAYERSTILAWASHANAECAAADDAVPDPTRTVWLRRDDDHVARFLSNGWSFAQAERHSIQPIPVDHAVLRAACDPTRAAAAGYEVVTWVGPSSEEYLDDLARLNEGMATDPPLGEVDWRPEIWDADRVRRSEERAALTGTFLTTAVRHIGTGRLVGFTQINTSHAHPEVAYQWSTIVLAEHRGHGLGLLLKAVNARLLQESFPRVRRVHTWNADENDWMLKVNVALGYAKVGIEACWQKVLDLG